MNFVSEDDQGWSDELEGQVLATAATRRVLVTSWDTVRTAGISDVSYSNLLQAVQTHTDEAWDEMISEYRKYRTDMTTVDGVVLFRGRVVIPAVLRPQVLQSLHQAHQGTTGMTLRTQDSVWWPGITDDIMQNL